MLNCEYDIEEDALSMSVLDPSHNSPGNIYTMFPKTSLTGFPDNPDQSLCRLESITSCKIDRTPPIRSSRTC